MEFLMEAHCDKTRLLYLPNGILEVCPHKPPSMIIDGKRHEHILYRGKPLDKPLIEEGE